MAGAGHEAGGELNLAGNRGRIDCGGLEFLLIRYGSFFQLVQPLQGGHVSVAVAPSGDPLAIAAEVRNVLQPPRSS